jgi:DNA topoisomerase-1
MNVVIVESPSKAKTINKYLGKDYNVLASFGHVRDLPSKDGSVLPDQDFAMTYVINDRAKKHIKEIAAATKGASAIYLATDPDREGEAISWHIVEALRELKAIKKDTIVKRIAFNEITKKSVLEALDNPRDIDLDLVNAQQARRALDYLVGFTLSPVLWRKLPGSKSAGRVQSVALRLVCEREEEIEKFVSQEYWDIKVKLVTEKKESLTATLTHIDGKKLDKFALGNKAQAESVAELLKNKKYLVQDVEKKQVSRNPYPPFTTSSLQQEASRKLGFSPAYTMKLAQQLYEGVAIDGETVGLITYMRTDGVQLSNDAVAEIRKLIGKQFGDNYLPKAARLYKTKTKNAQEAHEAIRPTNIHNIPQKVEKFLDKDQKKLYELIWKRTVACQMENAILNAVAIIIETDPKYGLLRATGSTIAFDGFYTLYSESKDDEEDEEHKLLPTLNKADALKLDKVNPAQHFTEPPPRFGEASLIKKLEELGIGRPSTYVPIINILQEREYVKLEKKRFYPEERGRLVSAFLVNFFKKYVEYGFTAHLEDELDLVSEGKMQWKILLNNFWQDFYHNIDEVKKRDMTEIIEAVSNSLEHYLFAGEDKKHTCPSCHEGSLSLKISRFGAFIACSAYPECKYTKNVGGAQEMEAEGEGQNAAAKSEVLGVDPDTKLEVTLRKGPYGLYVQLGETENKKKAKRASIPAGIDPTTLDLSKALSLLSLPRMLGKHPETSEEISAGIGRFGPYLLYQGKYVSVKNQDILSMSLEEALPFLAGKAAKATNEPIKVLGKHPETGDEVALYSGRYGVYMKYQKNNVPIPKNMDAGTLALTEAVEIIAKFNSKKKA